MFLPLTQQNLLTFLWLPCIIAVQEVIFVGIGGRIKEVRKAAGLTQQKFAEAIGLKRNTVGNYEIELISPSDRTITDICRVFGVSEKWLRTGEGDMSAPESEGEPLDAMLLGASLSAREKALVKSFLELPQSSREAVVDFVEQCAKELNSQPQEIVEPDLASEVAALKRQNQELLARLEAIEKEDEISGRMPNRKNGADVRSSGLFSGMGNKKSSGV